MNRKRIVLWTAVWLGWCAIIVCLSMLPGKRVDPFFFFPLQDKVAHLFLYAVLAFCTDWCLRFHKNQLSRPQWLFVLGFAVLFAFHDEIQQSYIPGRNPSPGDIVANMIGASLYLVLARQDFYRQRVNAIVLRCTRHIVGSC